MQPLNHRTFLFLAFDVALIALCAFHFPTLLDRAQAPFVADESHGRILITSIVDSTACTNVQKGDELLFWKGMRVSSPDALEFLAELSSIGTRVPLTLRHGTSSVEAAIVLVPVYSIAYIVIVCMIGLVTFSLGVFVLLSRIGNLIAVTLHWSLVAMAVAVVTAYEGTTPANRMPLVSSLLFFLSYAGTGAAFFLFTMLFPRAKTGSSRLTVAIVLLPALVVVAFMTYYHTSAIMFTSVDAFIVYSSWFGLFHVLLLIYIAGGIFSFIHSYITSVTTEERKKLKWILWGLCLGPTPFLILVVVPHLFNITPPLREEYALLPLLVIPIAFVISFMKYRLLDIEFLIRRTTAYAIVLGGLLSGYVVLVSAIASLVGQVTASAGAAILIALLFEPLRTSVQHFVDKRFFRVQYNFRRAENHFIESIKHALSVAQLGETLVREANELIPLERAGFFTLHQPGNRLRLIAHEGFELLQEHAPKLAVEKLKTKLQLPVALTTSIEPGVPHESADLNVFHRWGMTLVFALLSEHSEILGFLVLGNKKSGARFSSEDVDLLRNVCTQAGLTIERITLQQELLIEHAESERLKDLNELKSDFVSYVSHELRTPLTSIKMFAELLRGRPRRLDRKGMDYLRIIEGESDRLNQMVTTILDAARMDKDMTIYEFKEVNLGDAATTALATMQYQLDKQGFHVEFPQKSASKRAGRKQRAAFMIIADREGVVHAVTNLISNAIKYSGKKKYLRISLSRNDGFALCRVQDKGVGISPEALPHLFDKFYRDPSHSNRVQGIGLGLPLVQHIMQAHEGFVEVESVPDKGSTFTLSFPVSYKKPQSGFSYENRSDHRG